MNIESITFLDYSNVIASILITILSLYAAWENLVNKRISRFGLDAVSYHIAMLFNKKKTKSARRDPQVIRKLGLMMLLVGVGGVYSTIDLLLTIFGA